MEHVLEKPHFIFKDPVETTAQTIDVREPQIKHENANQRDKQPRNDNLWYHVENGNQHYEVH
jgi:hypothetical protein